MKQSLGTILVSCSDDRTIRVYDSEKQFQMKMEFSTKLREEWHTLTYIALQKEGNLVAIGSQTSYLFIYNLETKEFIFSERIHMGGIEGLVWVKNKLITCGSDGCINIITILKTKNQANL
eukprot:TRINITY_DN10562_c0_g2_i1.p2 TRINITY_DN10562_c0_g2~~TRINITY_DN10562_c0_g2_i1.p2  ORF type:complete len:120 (-),score=19.77 TRINITY_DN10562_c0_g2_i1:1-360(-)